MLTRKRRFASTTSANANSCYADVRAHIKKLRAQQREVLDESVREIVADPEIEDARVEDLAGIRGYMAEAVALVEGLAIILRRGRVYFPENDRLNGLYGVSGLEGRYTA